MFIRYFLATSFSFVFLHYLRLSLHLINSVHSYGATSCYAIDMVNVAFMLECIMLPFYLQSLGVLSAVLGVFRELLSHGEINKRAFLKTLFGCGMTPVDWQTGVQADRGSDRVPVTAS